MFKQISIFCVSVFLGACAGGQIKQVPTQVRATKKVDFFAGGATQIAFKVAGTTGDMGLEGVLVAKKIGDEEFEVSVMTAGAYRVMQATVTPAGIAYRYLFKDADTSFVRGRINQFLNLLLADVGVYRRYRTETNTLTVTYKNKKASVRLMYKPSQTYPYAAQTITTLNTADLFYDEYAPATAGGNMQVPHELIYKDGNIEVLLTLISLK